MQMQPSSKRNQLQQNINNYHQEDISGQAGVSLNSDQLNEINKELQLQNILGGPGNQAEQILLSAKAYNSNLQTQNIAHLAQIQQHINRSAQ